MRRIWLWIPTLDAPEERVRGTPTRVALAWPLPGRVSLRQEVDPGGSGFGFKWLRGVLGRGNFRLGDGGDWGRRKMSPRIFARYQSAGVSGAGTGSSEVFLDGGGDKGTRAPRRRRARARLNPAVQGSSDSGEPRRGLTSAPAPATLRRERGQPGVAIAPGQRRIGLRVLAAATRGCPLHLLQIRGQGRR